MDNKEALATVEEQIRVTKDRRMYERLQTVRLRLMGRSILEIAEIMGRSDKTIRKYLHAYEKEGLLGLAMRFSPGPNQRLTEKQREDLKQVIVDKVPADVGFTAKFNWTLQLIKDYIERSYGYTYSIRGVSKLMERMGMSYTKPTYTLAAADPDKQQQFVEETFPALKRG
ncbi:transposase [Bradyrhizobium japonicum]|uniref:Transposase n=1 Tax=Bradyrhizobium japonicum TaxID=375 RepID=A0A0A3XHV2_BRAJP|nr:transposase [Bradyrhizobium japonicum]